MAIPRSRPGRTAEPRSTDTIFPDRNVELAAKLDGLWRWPRGNRPHNHLFGR